MKPQRRWNDRRGVFAWIRWAYHQLVPFAAIIIAAWAVYQASQEVERNQQAIHVSCLLLTEQLVQSGGARPPEGYKPSPAAVAQDQITMRLISRIRLTPADRAYIAERERTIREAGGRLIAPPCDEVSRDPASVERRLERRLERQQRP